MWILKVAFATTPHCTARITMAYSTMLENDCRLLPGFATSVCNQLQKLENTSKLYYIVLHSLDKKYESVPERSA